METINSKSKDTKIKIEELDFSMIIEKMIRVDTNISKVWTKDQANKAVQQYRNFLFLLWKYRSEYRSIPPSIEIDEVWHHHILDTRKYHADCIKIFGEYIHHFPYFGMRGKSDFEDLNRCFEITQELYLREFGEYIYEIK